MKAVKAIPVGALVRLATTVYDGLGARLDCKPPENRMPRGSIVEVVEAGRHLFEGHSVGRLVRVRSGDVEAWVSDRAVTLYDY